MRPGGPLDPFLTGKFERSDPWAEIFAKPKAGVPPRRQKGNPDAPASSDKPGELQPLGGEDDPAPPIAEVHLSNPRWGVREGFFNEKVDATVDGELSPEFSHLTKVSFTLLANLPDGSVEQMETKEAHLKNGVATAELTLWIPSYRDEAGLYPGKGEFFFLAKHRQGEELRSGILPVSTKRKIGDFSARPLGRGVRGEDVLGWQRFLMRLRLKPEFAPAIQEIVEDGIFGWETSKATMGFQRHIGLNSDGIVGPETREKAELLGAVFEGFPTVGKTEGALQSVRKGNLPVFPGASAPLVATPPSSSKGSSREASWNRLRAEGWRNSLPVQVGLKAANAVLQSVEDGSGDFVYDEYAVTVERLPEGIGPENLLLEMAENLNGTVRNPEFDFINVFKRRGRVTPRAGDIIDIDIMGPDEGSVVLAELEATFFIYQTLDCPETWSHPENGSREFGFQVDGARITFYTRGVSRPGNFIIGMLGSEPQRRGWTAMMKGLTDRINARGGKSDFRTFGMVKERRSD